MARRTVTFVGSRKGATLLVAFGSAIALCACGGAEPTLPETAQVAAFVVPVGEDPWPTVMLAFPKQPATERPEKSELLEVPTVLLSQRYRNNLEQSGIRVISMACDEAKPAPYRIARWYAVYTIAKKDLDEALRIPDFFRYEPADYLGERFNCTELGV